MRTGSLCHTFLPHNSVHILLRYQTTFFSHITPSVCTKIFVVMSAPNSQYYESVVNLQVPNLPTSPSYPPISFPSCCQPALPNMISLPSVLRYAQSLACWFPLPELVTRTDTQPQGPLSASPTWPYSHLPTPQRSVGIYIFLYPRFSSHSSPNNLARYVGDQPQTPQSPLHDMYETPSILPEYIFNSLLLASTHLGQPPRLLIKD